MAAKKPAARETLVVGSKVKGHIRGKGLMAAGDLIDAVSNAVYKLLDEAAERTKANKRSTVRPHDL